jgi:hypothetical protein
MEYASYLHFLLAKKKKKKKKKKKTGALKTLQSMLIMILRFYVYTNRQLLLSQDKNHHKVKNVIAK